MDPKLATQKSARPTHDGEPNTAARISQPEDFVPRRRGVHSGAPTRRPTPVRLLALKEVTDAWALSADQIYRRLTPLQRPGQKPYYSEAEAKARLGEPARPLKVGRIGSSKPACLSRDDLELMFRVWGCRFRGRRIARPVMGPSKVRKGPGPISRSNATLVAS